MAFINGVFDCKWTVPLTCPSEKTFPCSFSCSSLLAHFLCFFFKMTNCQCTRHATSLARPFLLPMATACHPSTWNLAAPTGPLTLDSPLMDLHSPSSTMKTLSLLLELGKIVFFSPHQKKKEKRKKSTQLRVMFL